MFTLQETFDIVAKHLLTQNKKSEALMNKYSEASVLGCAYRGLHGLKCAAGILIPDDQYDPRFEGRDIINVHEQSLKNFPHNISLVRRLQLVHDNYDPERWGEELREVAADFNLTYWGEKYVG